MGLHYCASSNGGWGGWGVGGLATTVAQWSPNLHTVGPKNGVPHPSSNVGVDMPNSY